MFLEKSNESGMTTYTLLYQEQFLRTILKWGSL